MAALGAAEFAPVVSQDRPDRHPEGLIEGQDARVEEVARSHRHLRGVDLGEGERAEDIDDDLDVDLADALQGASGEGVLVEELAGARGFHVAAPELDAVALEETQLLLGEDERALLGGLLQAEQALQAGLEVVASPDAADAGDADVYAVEPE